MRGTSMQQMCIIITARYHTPLVSHHLAAHLLSYTPISLTPSPIPSPYSTVNQFV